MKLFSSPPAKSLLPSEIFIQPIGAPQAPNNELNSSAKQVLPGGGMAPWDLAGQTKWSIPPIRGPPVRMAYCVRQKQEVCKELPLLNSNRQSLLVL